MTERDDFGPCLRRERERRGISLQDLASVTKISASLFAAMERNDFSRWPSGIFGRAFLRAYADAVGLDAEEIVGNYERLFAGETQRRREPGAEKGRVAATAGVAGVLEAKASASVARARMVLAEIDLGAALAAGLLAGLLFGWSAAWPATAVTAVLVFAAGSLYLKSFEHGEHLGETARQQGPGTAVEPHEARLVARKPEFRMAKARRHNGRGVEMPQAELRIRGIE
jgi:transcriptional regulator with XRE-family HTH domain